MGNEAGKGRGFEVVNQLREGKTGSNKQKLMVLDLKRSENPSRNK